jgi:hypothetical protein
MLASTMASVSAVAPVAGRLWTDSWTRRPLWTVAPFACHSIVVASRLVSLRRVSSAGKSRRRRGHLDVPAPRSEPGPGYHYGIAYYQRHSDDDPATRVPGRDFLAACPPAVRARFRAVVIAVAAAPPPRFAGGGKWEAMHGEMSGFYEVRIDGPPGRTHYRLFCVLDSQARGHGPMLIIIDGDKKPVRTEMPAKVYARVRRYRDEYLSRNPRSLA